MLSVEGRLKHKSTTPQGHPPGPLRLGRSHPLALGILLPFLMVLVESTLFGQITISFDTSMLRSASAVGRFDRRQERHTTTFRQRKAARQIGSQRLASHQRDSSNQRAHRPL